MDAYNLCLDSEKEIVYDEEALEFATKNSLLFFHISSEEKYESGVNQLFYSIIKEYYLRNYQYLNQNY